MNVEDAKASINLLDSYVKELNIQIMQPPSTINDTKNTMKIDYSISGISEQENSILGKLSLSLKIELLNQANSLCAKCELEYLGIIGADIKTISKEDFVKMIELNGVMILYQMARPLITSITAQAGIIPPITIPLINVHKLVKNKAENDKRISENEKK
jgi:preprotein translocase subunit SecB